MTPKKAPSKMAPTRIQEIPFTDRLMTRERVLAWISSDIGLCDFLVPRTLTESWSPEQKQTWTEVIVDTYLNAKNTDIGKLSRAKVMAREQAGNLRRGCDKLRQEIATYRDIAKLGVTIEGLWNDTSSDLDDPTWAKCSLLFDTALISLRVSYLWLYDKSENTGATVETRKKLFRELVDSFFNINAPTDDKDDKHSANFRDLLAVWRDELMKYVEADDFHEKLNRLEQTQPLREVASGIQRFLDTINIDQSWMWKMKLLDDELVNGHIVRKRRKRGRAGKNGKKSPDIEAVQKEDEQPEASYAESSDFEPAAADSDFDYEVAEKEVDKADARDDEEESLSSSLSEDLARGMMSEKDDDGVMIRRSLRVAQARKARRRRSVRSALRSAESPPRRRQRTANGNRRKRPNTDDVLNEGFADDEPSIAVESPYRSRRSARAVPQTQKRNAPSPIELLKKKWNATRRRTGLSARLDSPLAPGGDMDEEDGNIINSGLDKDTLHASRSAPSRKNGASKDVANSAAEARRKRLMAALTEEDI